MRFHGLAGMVLLGSMVVAPALAADPVPNQSQPFELTEKAAKERAEQQAKASAKSDAEIEAARAKAAEWDAKQPYAVAQKRRQQVGLTLFWLALLCSIGALVAPWFLIRKGRWIMLAAAGGLAFGGTLLPMLHIWFGDAGHELLINGLAIVLSWIMTLGLLIAAIVGKDQPRE